MNRPRETPNRPCATNIDTEIDTMAITNRQENQTVKESSSPKKQNVKDSSLPKLQDDARVQDKEKEIPDTDAMAISNHSKKNSVKELPLAIPSNKNQTVKESSSPKLQDDARAQDTEKEIPDTDDMAISNHLKKNSTKESSSLSLSNNAEMEEAEKKIRDEIIKGNYSSTWDDPDDWVSWVKREEMMQRKHFSNDPEDWFTVCDENNGDDDDDSSVESSDIADRQLEEEESTYRRVSFAPRPEEEASSLVASELLNSSFAETIESVAPSAPPSVASKQSHYSLTLDSENPESPESSITSNTMETDDPMEIDDFYSCSPPSILSMTSPRNVEVSPMFHIDVPGHVSMKKRLSLSERIQASIDIVEL